MRWRCALLLWLLVLSAAAPLRAEPQARRALLEECAQQASPTRRGIEALRADCPEIDTALVDLGLERLLPADWDKHLSPRALADLSALAGRYARPSPAVLPSPSSLRNIAMQMAAPTEAPSWWERFKSWLASWLDSDRSRWPDWLRDLHLSDTAARWLFYGSIGLVILTALVVVVRELRAAGVFGSARRGSLARAAAAPSHGIAARTLTAEDIDAAPEQLRPVILLRLLVTALARCHRLERDGILTCRELISAARFDTPAQRDIFTSVALSAERVLYGDPRRPAAPLHPDLLGNARGLYGQLVTATAEQSARQ
jgi:hypothetical protein